MNIENNFTNYSNMNTKNSGNKHSTTPINNTPRLSESYFNYFTFL